MPAILTADQLTKLKADIEVNAHTIDLAGVQVPIKDTENTPDINHAIANDWYNIEAEPKFIVWRDLPIRVLGDTILFANFMPKDPIPTDKELNVAIWSARAHACHGKQLNLQLLTAGRSIAAMKLTNYRKALEGCLTNIPAGTGGSLLDANWASVFNAAKFPALNIEKLLSSGAGTSAATADLDFEGKISGDDVTAARDLA